MPAVPVMGLSAGLAYSDATVDYGHLAKTEAPWLKGAELRSFVRRNALREAGTELRWAVRHGGGMLAGIATGSAVTSLTGKTRDGVCAGAVVGGALTYLLTRDAKWSLLTAVGGGTLAGALGTMANTLGSD